MNILKSNIFACAALAVIFIMTDMYLFSEPQVVTAAVLPVENMNGNPDQDYLSAIISAVIVEDLSSAEGMKILERDSLDKVLKEQRLQLSGITQEGEAVEAGRLLGAGYMISGGYVFLGEDVFINISVIQVSTGISVTFSGRGYTENTVHSISEKIYTHITGKSAVFFSPDGEKSILAEEQRKPGVLKLYSYIVDARVYIDEEFAGYTTGDSTVPLVLELPPGRHSVRVHLTGNFGVVTQPEITFGDWNEDFFLEPGQSIIIEDKTRHFNDTIYKLQRLLRGTLRIVPGKEETDSVSESLVFSNREGREIPVGLDINWSDTAGGESGYAEVVLRYDGEERNLSYTAKSGKDLEFTEEIGIIRLELSLECRPSYYWDLDYSIRRTDIHQGMHLE